MICVEECGLVNNFMTKNQWHSRSAALDGQNLNLQLVGRQLHLPLTFRDLLRELVGYLLKLCTLKFI